MLLQPLPSQSTAIIMYYTKETEKGDTKTEKGYTKTWLSTARKKPSGGHILLETSSFISGLTSNEYILAAFLRKKSKLPIHLTNKPDQKKRNL